MRILIINGPNLNLTGQRQPEIYGTKSFDELLPELQGEFPEAELSYYQSNHAGQLIDQLQEVAKEVDAVVLNAGAYTHTSLALGDAVAALRVPLIEVHMSNIWSRSPQRHQSYISKHARGVIAGFGMESYRLALQALLRMQEG